MSYFVRLRSRRRELRISAAAPTEAAEHTSENDSRPPRRRWWFRADGVDGDPAPIEGLDTPYNYARPVGSEYSGPLRPSDDYVEVFNIIDDRGIAALLPEQKDQSLRRGALAKARLRKSAESQQR